MLLWWIFAYLVFGFLYVMVCTSLISPESENKLGQETDLMLGTVFLVLWLLWPIFSVVTAVKLLGRFIKWMNRDNG